MARDFLGDLVREMFHDPIVEVQGSEYVEVIINRIDGKLAVNLINTSGPHNDKRVFTYDTIYPVGPLKVTIRHPERPIRVTVEPGNRNFRWDYRDSKISLTITGIHIHDIIVVE